MILTLSDLKHCYWFKAHLKSFDVFLLDSLMDKAGASVIAQSITSNSSWCVTHNEIFHPRLNGAWSLSTVMHSVFLSRRAGNWTWNMSSYLGARLFSKLKWIHYDVRDEQSMSVTLSIYLYLPFFLSFPHIAYPQSRLDVLPLGQKPFFNPFKWRQFSWGLGVIVLVMLLICCISRREWQLKAGQVEVNEVTGKCRCVCCSAFPILRWENTMIWAQEAAVWCEGVSLRVRKSWFL